MEAPPPNHVPCSKLCQNAKKPLKTDMHTTKHNTFTQKNHLKKCKLEVRHAFESKTCNLKPNQNTKTTHLRNLTKNETPLSLAIAKNQKYNYKSSTTR